MPPTPYPDVNAVLLMLLNEVQTILGDRFVGLYLYGSLAADKDHPGGGFDPHKSDIDFVVVTRSSRVLGETVNSFETRLAYPGGLVAALQAMHTRLWASGLKWAAKLEGTYIPQASLRRYDPEDGPFPCVNEGKFYLARHGSEWVLQRHILRESGVIVEGLDIRPMIDPISPDEIRAAVRSILHERWRLMLADPDPRLSGRAYQAFTTLTMCRALHALQHGEIASKPVAARWAQQEFPRWVGLIQRALDWPDGMQPDEMDATLDLIRQVLGNA